MWLFLLGFISGFLSFIGLIYLIFRFGRSDDDDYYASGPNRGLPK